MLSQKHVIAMSIYVIVLTCLILAHHTFNKRLILKRMMENKINKKIEGFNYKRDHLYTSFNASKSTEAVNFDNPELPYTFGPHHFQLGTFCMQWGTSNTNVTFPFDFDRQFITLITSSRTSTYRSSAKLKNIRNDGARTRGNGIEKEIYFLAIGLKVDPVEGYTNYR